MATEMLVGLANERLGQLAWVNGYRDASGVSQREASRKALLEYISDASGVLSFLFSYSRSSWREHPSYLALKPCATLYQKSNLG